MINPIRYYTAIAYTTTSSYIQAAYHKATSIAVQLGTFSKETVKEAAKREYTLNPKNTHADIAGNILAPAIQNVAASVIPRIEPATRVVPKTLTYHEKAKLLLEDSKINTDPIDYCETAGKEFVNNVTHYSLMQFIYEVMCKQTPKGDVYSDIIRNNREDSPIKYRFFSLLDKSKIPLSKRIAAKIFYQIAHPLLQYLLKFGTGYFFSKTSPMVQEKLIKFLGKDTYLEMVNKQNAKPNAKKKNLVASIETTKADIKEIRATVQNFVASPSTLSLAKKVRKAFSKASDYLIKKAKLSIPYRLLAYAARGALSIVFYAGYVVAYIYDALRQYLMKKFIKKWAFSFIQHAYIKAINLMSTPNVFSYNAYKILNQIMQDLIKEAEKGDRLFNENDSLLNHKELHDFIKMLVDEKAFAEEKTPTELSWYGKIKNYFSNTGKTAASTQAAHFGTNLIPPFCNLLMSDLYLEKRGAQFMDLVNIAFKEGAPKNITSEELNSAREEFESNTARFLTLVLANTVTRQNDVTRVLGAITPDFVKMASYYGSKKTIEFLHQKGKEKAMEMLEPQNIYKKIFGEEFDPKKLG